MAKLIPRNTMIPAEKTLSFTTSQDSPSEIDILFEGERLMTKAVLKDCRIVGKVGFGIRYACARIRVTRLTLGIDTGSGVMAKLIPRNTRVPAEKTLIFTTLRGQSGEIDIKLFEGERLMTKDCRYLGRFVFSLPPIPAASKFKVMLKVLDDGSLNFGITLLGDKGRPDSKEKITTKLDETLSQEDIERMVQEAKEHAAEDTRARESINGHASLQKFMYAVRVALNDHHYELKGMIGDAERDRIEKVLKETTEWLDENQHGVEREEYDEKHSIVSKSIENVIGPFVDDGARVPSEPVPP
jgi:molecular chaperone DnaK (HSP70)